MYREWNDNEIQSDNEAEYAEFMAEQRAADMEEAMEDFDATVGQNGDLSDEELDDFLKQCDATPPDPMEDD